MFTYIIIAIVLFIVFRCFGSDKTKTVSFVVFVIAALLTSIIHTVYFGVNYHTIPTTQRIINDTIEVCDSAKLFKKEKVFIYNEYYYTMNDIINDSISIVKVNNDTIQTNSIVSITENFKLKNSNWICSFLYPTKSNKKIVTLTKKDYELYTTFKNNVEKRKSSL